ncbi:MAG: hypothetical protein U0232_06550 [Thermomicrobiales bacterium]
MAIVAMIGLTHPHSRMYSDTLDMVDEVAELVLCDEDCRRARDRRAHARRSPPTAIPTGRWRTPASPTP